VYSPTEATVSSLRPESAITSQATRSHWSCVISFDWPKSNNRCGAVQVEFESKSLNKF
jgi:hypothetical protein